MNGNEITHGEVLLDAQGVGGMLGWSARSVWRNQGRLPPAVRPSPGTLRWRRSDLLRWIAEGCPDRDGTVAAPRRRRSRAEGVVAAHARRTKG